MEMKTQRKSEREIANKFEVKRSEYYTKTKRTCTAKYDGTVTQGKRATKQTEPTRTFTLRWTDTKQFTTHKTLNFIWKTVEQTW